MRENLRMTRPFLRAIMFTLIIALLFTGYQWHAPQAYASIPVSKKLIVGYWHNFDNGSGNIRLRDVSSDFDVINVSFAEPINGAQGGTIGFAPYNATEADFIADVQYLQSQGKKVMISIGGANGQVQLVNTQARDKFVSTMKGIITKYGFNGFDIDFEGHSLYLNAGDSDFRSPQTPVITNLISAVRELHDFYGESFMLTMAPETFFVQLGYSFYGGSCISCDNRAGSYLPVIYALRDILDWLQVQHYNSGSITALDDRYYSMGSADFHVAMVDMMLTGFPVGRNPNNLFPALRPDQVVIGLPANANAGGGFTSVAEVHKALNYLMKGVSYGGGYQLRNGAHPGMRGLMTWSINWDKFNNFEFSSNHRTYLNQFEPGGVEDLIPPSVPGNLSSPSKTSNSVNLSWNASTDNVGVTGYTVSYGSNSINVAGTSTTISGLSANTAYTFTVKAKDAAGNQSVASNALTVTTNASSVDTTAPTAPTNLQVSGKTASSVSLSWTASTDNVGVTGYDVFNGSSLVTSVMGTTATVNGLNANTAYTFTVTAKDAAGNVSTGTSIQSTTDNNQSGTDPWAAGVSYTVGKLVTYGGATYSCRQSHTSLQGWEPSNVPALWLLQ
ncbi:fibronectin type III domain-containing protein [Paenibacillus sp. IHBB 10380]|uniref:fibronectin type III domain-containing protein n=1 Tax=Paenibacillus sp. IHBB 10380 TaxID=1566358 RepID=UPI0006964236|nr:glycosyl hydrolase family 18 protein [Paenibacillus sp. IHBB 10380]